MKTTKAAQRAPEDVDAYIASCRPEVRAILQNVRDVIRAAAPDAAETISYRIPAFALNGRILVYFAAFKNHIGLYPPVRGDARLEKAAAVYAGEKGNLRFPLDEPIPYDLIARIIESRVRQHASRQPAARRVARRSQR